MELAHWGSENTVDKQDFSMKCSCVTWAIYMHHHQLNCVFYQWSNFTEKKNCKKMKMMMRPSSCVIFQSVNQTKMLLSVSVRGHDSFSDMFCMSLILTLDGRQHGASHGQHKAQRTAQQEAVWHLKVESAGIQHQAGATAATHLYTLLHQTGEQTWKQNINRCLLLHSFSDSHSLSSNSLMLIHWIWLHIYQDGHCEPRLANKWRRACEDFVKVAYSAIT